MKRIINVIGALVLICGATVTAQTVGGSFMLTSPQGEFKQNVDRLGYGFQVEGTLWSPGRNIPFSIGLNAGYMVYGQQTERRPWPGFPEVTLKVSRLNSMANVHLLLLFSPFYGAVRPYAEGLAGGSYIFTTSEVSSENSDESIAQSTNYDDFNWSYGWGAGIMIQVAKDLGDVQRLFLDVKVRYLYGTEAKYLTENDIDVINLTEVRYRPRQSKTDMLTLNIGVIAFF